MSQYSYSQNLWSIDNFSGGKDPANHLRHSFSILRKLNSPELIWRIVVIQKLFGVCYIMDGFTLTLGSTIGNYVSYLSVPQGLEMRCRAAVFLWYQHMCFRPAGESIGFLSSVSVTHPTIVSHC
jgi:hypothetical protein